ncbi:hypothetical protein EBZ39_04615 [bacterium]|nr:hypothetical protein [bacterium]
MHTKRKGNIGQFAVGLALAKLGYSIFTEEGDISRIDLIAERDGKLLRFQCKAVTPTNGCIHVPLKKTGPNYCLHYSQKMFDYFGVYDLLDGEVYAVPAQILQQAKHNFSLRKTAAKNNQTKHTHMAATYKLSAILGGVV